MGERPNVNPPAVEYGHVWTGKTLIEYTVDMNVLCWTHSLKPQNQDAVGSGENFIAVADGITPLTRGSQEAEATAAFSSDLMQGLAQRGVSPTTARSDLSSAIAYAQQQCEFDKVSSTLTVATWDDNNLHISTLGDCVGIVLTTSGWRIVHDPSYAAHDVGYLVQVLDHVRNGSTWKKAYSSLTREMKKDRRVRNTGRGTWIVSGSVDPAEVVDHFHEVTFPRDQVEACILISDGVDIWRELFKIVAEYDLLTASETDLDSYWKKAVELQEGDPQRSTYPRLSDLDDASVARVDFR